MRSNVMEERPPVKTHEGGPGKRFTPQKELERAVLTCLLFEDTFYEKGSTVAERIADLVKQCPLEFVSRLAIKARNEFHLRHVPLFLATEIARTREGAKYIAATLNGIIQRPDELGEFLALYWKPKKHPISKQVRVGLRNACQKFNEYELAKWDKGSAAISLKDILKLVRPKPESEERSALWKRVLKDELKTPDTWETELSAGKDKRETFTRLIQEKKLGGLALLRNLRNCVQSGVDADLLREAIASNPFKRVLPFRFLAAARHAPQLEPALDAAMQRVSGDLPRLPGRTALLIDVSGSMDAVLSAKSDLTRLDAACGLAIVAAFTTSQYMVATFSNAYVEVPPRSGMVLRDAIVQSQPHSGTLGATLAAAYSHLGFREADRVIVVTDEQSSDGMPHVLSSNQHCYLVNVAPYQFGVSDQRGWHRISGFSERIFDYIAAHESED